MTDVNIVGFASVDDTSFRYDTRTGKQIPDDTIIAKKYQQKLPDNTLAVLSIIQIQRDKNEFEVVVLGYDEELYSTRVVYNDSNKTFYCDEFDPRKIIPAILENEDTKLYFMARAHPYYSKTFVYDYTDKNEEGYQPPDKKEERKEDGKDEKKEDIRHRPNTYEFMKTPPKDKKDNCKYKFLRDLLKENAIHNLQYEDEEVPENIPLPKDEESISIWTKEYQDRIQEPDSHSEGCDSDGCQPGHEHSDNRPVLTAIELKEIDELFGTDNQDDKSIRSLYNERHIPRDIPRTDQLDEFDNDTCGRHCISSFEIDQNTGMPIADHGPRMPIYKLHSKMAGTLTDVTEEEKRVALAQHHVAQILGEMDLARVLKESAQMYTSRLDSEIEQAKTLSMLMIPDDVIQPGLGSDASSIVKPPKLPERDDNL